MGNVTRKDDCFDEHDMLEVTIFYASKYGKFTSELDRGMLKIPYERAFQWIFFCYIISNVVKEKVCRVSLTLSTPGGAI